MAATIALNHNELPHKVYQDDFRPGRGNALQAAVASIFGLDLGTVPNFVVLPEGYETAIENFCKERCGTSVKLKLQQQGDDTTTATIDRYEGQLCLLRGKSPRGDHGHVVVARRIVQGECGESTDNVRTGGFEMIHDPHPDETFLDENEPFGWCMFFEDSAKKEPKSQGGLPAEGTEWPKLVGKDIKVAERFLRDAHGPKLEIVEVLEGSMVTMDYRIDRVRLFVDEKTQTTVVEVPVVG
jgi:hypothetical protein